MEGLLLTIFEVKEIPLQKVTLEILMHSNFIVSGKLGNILH